MIHSWDKNQRRAGLLEKWTERGTAINNVQSIYHIISLEKPGLKTAFCGTSLAKTIEKDILRHYRRRDAKSHQSVQAWGKDLDGIQRYFWKVLPVTLNTMMKFFILLARTNATKHMILDSHVWTYLNTLIIVICKHWSNTSLISSKTLLAAKKIA